MAARTAQVLFAAPPPSNVTSRVATIIVTTAGVAAPPVVIDYIATPAATFPCQDGDSLSATAVDTDSAGSSPVSNTITVTVVPIVSPPAAPVLSGFAVV